MADTRTFACTDAQLGTLAALLEAHGMQVDLTRAGEAQAEGWDVSWAYPTLGTVAVTVNKHPFAEEGFLWAKLGTIFSRQD